MQRMFEYMRPINVVEKWAKYLETKFALESTFWESNNNRDTYYPAGVYILEVSNRKLEQGMKYVQR